MTLILIIIIDFNGGNQYITFLHSLIKRIYINNTFKYECERECEYSSDYMHECECGCENLSE